MSRTTVLTGVVDLTTKKIALSGQVAIREKFQFNFTGYGTATASDLIVAIVYQGALVALLQPVVSYTTYYGGVVSLNTLTAVNAFATYPANAKLKMSFVIWDTTNSCTLCNDFINVQNNVYDATMDDPVSVGPIGAVEYAPIEKGVDNGNSHDHNGGDGGDLSPYYFARVPAGANFRMSTDGTRLEIQDSSDLTWHQLFLNQGALGVGGAV